MRSLQRTLALRFGLTMFVALVGVMLWAYQDIRATVEQELDRGLASAAALMADVVAAGEHLSTHRGPGDAIGFDEMNRLVVTRDSSGRIMEYNAPSAADLPLDSASFAAARTGERRWTTRPFAGSRIRSIYMPGPPGNPGGIVVLQVSASLAPVEAASRRLLLRALAMAMIGAIATGLGAGWLARSSLQPVADVAAQARSVTARGAHQRITAYADVIELQDLIQVLNDMLSRLERALNQQRRIISDVGHELRTPITAMRGEVEVALRGTREPGEYRRLLSSVLEEIDRLGLIGDELITLARYEAGQLLPERAPVNLGRLASSRIAQALERAPGRRIRLETGMPEGECLGDQRLLGMALDELLENALRHTPRESEVCVTLQVDPERAAFSVEDGGPGVPSEVLDRLFEPFFLADFARTRGRGPGLGLTTVMAIAGLHGGSVTASQSSLGGLKVTVSLPRTPPDAQPAPG